MLFNRKKNRKRPFGVGGIFYGIALTGFTVYTLPDVTVSDVSFLWAGLANGVFGRNIKETTSDIAKEK